MLSVAGRFVAHDFTPSAALASGPIWKPALRAATPQAAPRRQISRARKQTLRHPTAQRQTIGQRSGGLVQKLPGCPPQCQRGLDSRRARQNPSYGCGAKVALRLAVLGKLSAVVGAAPPKLARGSITVTLSPAPKNTSPGSSARATWSSSRSCRCGGRFGR
jgi:hypothetical protein